MSKKFTMDRYRHVRGEIHNRHRFSFDTFTIAHFRCSTFSSASSYGAQWKVSLNDKKMFWAPAHFLHSNGRSYKDQ
jgi:hypothetical protein